MVEQTSNKTLVRSHPDIAWVVRPGCTLRVEQGLGIAKLRVVGDPAASFRRVVGVESPAPHRQVEDQGVTFAWLAPSEWLLTGPEPRVAERLARIVEAGADDALAVDVTHARVCLLLDGRDARQVLAAHCPLDLWPAAFPVGAVTRSLISDTGFFIARLADSTDGPQFRLIVDQAMAAYAVRMLAGPKPRTGEQN